jgi:hypothetical protein
MKKFRIGQRLHGRELQGTSYHCLGLVFCKRYQGIWNPQVHIADLKKSDKIFVLPVAARRTSFLVPGWTTIVPITANLLIMQPPSMYME